MKQTRSACEVRRLLKITYDIIGYPAACKIEPFEPYKSKNVPHFHNGFVQLFRKEMLERQLNKKIMTEESFALYDYALRNNRCRNIFDIRDNLPKWLDAADLTKAFESSAETLAGTNCTTSFVLAHPRDVKSYRVIESGEILENNQRDHHFIMYTDSMLDGITGIKYPKSHLVVHELKEIKPES